MKEYVVKEVKGTDEGFLKDVLNVDKRVYPREIQGTLEELKERYKSKNQHFLLVYKEEKVVGYICFFPITDDLSTKINDSDVIYDNYIRAKDISDFKKDKLTDIYVISVAIVPEEQDTDAIRVLTNNFMSILKNKVKEGYLLNNIMTTASSEDGIKFFNNLNFSEIKTLKNNYKLMSCNINEIRTIKFAKAYKDDFYIMIPFTGEEPTIKDYDDETGKTYVSLLNKFTDYECNNNIVKSLNRKFIGKLLLGCIDDYYTKEVLQTQEAYLFLTSHKKTKLHILTVVVPDNKMSTTMLQDQASSDNLYVYNNDWVNLIKYMEEKYDLKICGKPKTIVCLSNKPRNIEEMSAMLASEAYEGEYTLNYDEAILTSKTLEEIAKNDISQYGFFEAYSSDTAIVFILKNFSEIYKENLRQQTLVLVVAELVMLQDSSIKRTNQKIVEGLSKEGNVSLKFIENLYKVFGKTVVFWDTDNFYYRSSQSFADSIYKSFKTHEHFELYKKDQEFLEHIVDLKNAQSTNRENKILNIIAILLALLQVVPVIIEFVNWILGKVSFSSVLLAISGTGITFTIILLIIIKFRKTKKKF